MPKCTCRKKGGNLCERGQLLYTNLLAAFKRYTDCNLTPTRSLSEELLLKEKYDMRARAYFLHTKGESY